MAETINARNGGAYLLYLAEQLQRPLPPPYNNPAAFAGQPEAAIAASLETLYDQLGIPRQTGWSYEDAFLKDAAATAPVPTAATAMPGADYVYYPVAPGIGRLNYRPFLYFIEERLRRPLNLFATAAWDNYTDEAIRQALPGIYRGAGILPDEAKQLELGFLAVYHQKVAPVPVVPLPSSMPAAAPPPGHRPDVQPSPRRRWYWMPLILLLVAAAVGAWLWNQYRDYMGQPMVYALTNNIALRKDASDTSPVLGRMDLYGQYLDVKGVKQTSASSLKLSTSELTNGFYRATTSHNFWDYLTGDDSTMYVHAKYVTTDRSLYDKYSDDLSNLRNDHNELDKLGFIYRQLIGRATMRNSEGAIIKIAAACRPSPKLSRTAPLSIGKYRNKANGELDVVIQATDGYCYVLRGGENELPPSITPVMIQYGLYSEPMKSGGMFAKESGGNTLRFEYCADGQVFFGRPPYTLFTPLPARQPDPVPADGDEDPALTDTML
jgi:hypothetical protein